MAHPFAMRVVLGLLVAIAGDAAAAAAAAVPAWFDGTASTRANAGNAARAATAPGDAARVLVEAGDDPAHVVLAVVDAYNRCDAVYDSVRAAVQLAPDRAGDIVQAAASSARCPCSGEALWQRSRLERRIRIEQRRDPLLVAALCGCAAAGAEAAVAVAPERADEVVEAALGAGRRASAVVDTLGQIGAPRGPAAGADGSLLRVAARRCDRDVAPSDEFVLGTLWQAAALAPSALNAERDPGCADPAGSGKQDEPASDLTLAGYVAAAGDRVLVLHNGTRDAIDLAAGNYQLDLHFPESGAVGRRIALSGRIEPGADFVLAGRGSAAPWLARADQRVGGGLLAPSEAVVLRRGLDRDGCECSVASVAGVANGLGPAGRDWLAVQAGVANGSTSLSIADRVGQVRPETFARGDWRSPLADSPLQLARAAGECAAERRADAPFVLGTPWQQLALPPAGEGRCASTPTSLLLARIEAWAPDVEGDPPARAVQVFNGTGVAVDLARDGYVLEVFAAGAREPARVIPLQGTLAQGMSLRIASKGAPEQVRADAAVLSDDLAQRALDAVVLRRIATGVGGVCRADVYAAAAEVGAPPIVIASRPDVLPEGEPRTDESPIDPDRGGDVTSPN